MEIILKKNIFKLIGRYSVKDVNDNDILRVERTMFSIFNTHTVMDLTDNHICKIKRKVLSLFPNYRIFLKNGRVINVKKKTGSIKKKFSVMENDEEYEIDGDVLENTFSIKKGEEVLASVDKKIVNMLKVYDISIKEIKFVPTIISIIVALDIVKYKKFAYII